MNEMDTAKTIRYIIDNFDNLQIGENDKREILKLLEVFKIQIAQRIAETSIQSNENLRAELENARAELQKRLDLLRERLAKKEGELNYPDFIPPEKSDDVPVDIQARTEEQLREKHEQEKAQWEAREKPHLEYKIEKLKKVIEEIEQQIQTLDTPIEFIQQVVADHFEGVFCPTHESEEIVKACAHGMSHSQGMNYALPTVFPNSPIFGRKGTGYDSTYIPNPESISLLLRTINNPDLMEELTQYFVVSSKEKQQQRILEARTKEQEVLENEEVCGNVETFIRECAETRQQRAEARKNRADISRRGPMAVAIPQNLFQRILFKWTGKAKKAEEAEKEKYEKACAEARAEEAVIEKKYTEMMRQHIYRMDVAGGDELYKIAYTLYLNSIGFNPTAEAQPWFLNNSGGKLPDRIDDEAIKTLSEMLATSKPGELRASVIERIQPEQRVSDARDTLEGAKSQTSEVYTQLSPEAIEIIEKGCYLSELMRFKGKEGMEGSYHAMSPRVATIVLDALLKGVPTQEEAEKYGITFTEKDIEKREETIQYIQRRLKSKLDQISKTGEDMDR